MTYSMFAFYNINVKKRRVVRNRTYCCNFSCLKIWKSNSSYSTNNSCMEIIALNLAQTWQAWSVLWFCTTFCQTLLYY